MAIPEGAATRPRHGALGAASIWPGLGLTVALAALAMVLRALPGLGVLSPMIIAIILGMALHNLVGTPSWARAGQRFALRRILRLAIILLGFQITAAQVAEVGAAGLAVIAATLAATFLFTVWLGRLLGVDGPLTKLIAAGTSICGASAVIAADAVIQAEDEDAAYAVACVTLFGSIAMFAYPLLQGGFGLDARAYGLWAGASIHEIAQVVAAAFQAGPQAGDFGTIAKLARVMMLAPVVIALGLVTARQVKAAGGEASGAKPPMPWFVLGFIALAGLNSLFATPAEAKHVVATLTAFLLTMALAAMGLETDFAKLRAKGPRPLLLALAAFLFIASFSLLLVKLTAY